MARALFVEIGTGQVLPCAGGDRYFVEVDLKEVMHELPQFRFVVDAKDAQGTAGFKWAAWGGAGEIARSRMGNIKRTQVPRFSALSIRCRHHGRLTIP